MFWRTKKLGEVCVIKPPKNEARKKLRDNDLVSFVPMEDLGFLSKSFNVNKERKLKDVSGSYTYFADGDVLLAKITPCFENGKVGIASNLKNGIGFGSSEYIVFRPSKDLLSEYLFYFLSNNNFRKAGKKSMSGAVGHKRVAKEFIENSAIPLPPLPEQHRIVKILDDVFEKITEAKENAEKNLQNAKELIESYLQNIFLNPKKNWKKTKLGELCKDVQYGTSAKSKKTGEIPVLRMGNIQEGKFVWDSLVYTDDDKEIEKYSLRYNDILFNRTNSPELVGKSAIYKGEQPAIFAGYLIRINRKENLLDGDFLNYYLNFSKTREYGFSVMCSSVNQANINGTKLREYPIILPPLPQQKSIVARLDALSAETKKLEAIYKQKLTDLEELKKSVLKKAFDGEL